MYLLPERIIGFWLVACCAGALNSFVLPFLNVMDSMLLVLELKLGPSWLSKSTYLILLSVTSITLAMIVSPFFVLIVSCAFALIVHSIMPQKHAFKILFIVFLF
jgi:hypothetical protein